MKKTQKNQYENQEKNQYFWTKKNQYPDQYLNQKINILESIFSIEKINNQ